MVGVVICAVNRSALVAALAAVAASPARAHSAYSVELAVSANPTIRGFELLRPEIVTVWVLLVQVVPKVQ